MYGYSSYEIVKVLIDIITQQITRRNTVTIDKTSYQVVQAQITATQVQINDLGIDVAACENSADITNQLGIIQGGINAIDTWAQGYIDQADQQFVMASFLSELKVVFDKYTAEIEVGSDTEGYGLSYGGGSQVGIKLTATLNGLTVSKEINKAVIVGSDLV